MLRSFRLALICCAAVLIAACGGSAGPRSIRFMISGDPVEQQAYQQLVAAFEQGHPDIKVELTNIPSAGDFRTRLLTDFAAGTPPDITLQNYRRFGQYAARDLLDPIGPYLEQSQIIKPSDFYPAALAAFTRNDTLFCMPQNASSLVVYYNRNLFDAANQPYPSDDWTWEDFVRTAKALTRDQDGDGTIDQYGLGMEISVMRAAPFIWQNGGVVVDDQYLPTKLALTRLPALEALQWFVDLRQVHHVVPDRAEETAQDSESRFIAGHTAMLLNSRRGTPSYRQISQFAWDVAPLPQGKQRAGILHSDGFCLSQASKEKQAAWSFIEYANSPEGQRLLAATGRTVPSLKAVAESPAFLDPAQAPSRSSVFLAGLDDLQRVPNISTWEEIEKVTNEELARAFYGEISVTDAATLAVQRSEEYFTTAK